MYLPKVSSVTACVLLCDFNCQSSAAELWPPTDHIVHKTPCVDSALHLRCAASAEDLAQVPILRFRLCMHVQTTVSLKLENSYALRQRAQIPETHSDDANDDVDDDDDGGDDDEDDEEEYDDDDYDDDVDDNDDDGCRCRC